MIDKQIERLIKAERVRQRRMINLIASENYVSRDVLAALGSELTNKYAEGYSGARYYGGNEISDKIENLCQQRALKLFKLKPDDWAVNVQPLSGSPANLAVYLALVPPGGLPAGKAGKIMGLELAQGGHLTHGHKVSATGKFWQAVPYGLDKKTEVLNYDELAEIARREKPQIIVAGYTAYPRLVDWQKFRQIADFVNAYLLVDMSHLAGLVAAGVYPSPFPYADVVTTTTHKTLRGPRAALIFSRRISAWQFPFLAPSDSASGGVASRGETKTASLAKPALRLDQLIDRAVFPGLQGGPHLNQIAAVAVALKEAMTPKFKKYARQVVKNAQALGRELERLGWRLVSGLPAGAAGGTDSHLLLVDTWQNGQGISGEAASALLEKNDIIVNKNTIPFDARSPISPSGIRLGTAAETTRGQTENDFIALARRIDKILRAG